MKQLSAKVALLLSCSLINASSPSAPASPASSWVGLWRGVDPLDGGEITLSVTHADASSGVKSNDLNLRFSDSFIRACTSVPALLPEGFVGSGSPYNKRGIYLADVSIPEDNGPFDFPIEVYCYDESLEAIPISAKINNTLEMESDGTLVMTGPLLPKPDKYVKFFRLSTESSTTWAGMYAGVDPKDGGVVTLSIGQLDDSGPLKLRFSDTFIRACTSLPSAFLPAEWEGSGPTWSKRGIFLADAVADDAALVSPIDGSTNVAVEIYCFSGENDVDKPWALYNDTVTWSFEKRGGVVYMSGNYFFDSEQTDHAGGIENMRFHYISTAAPSGEENTNPGSRTVDDEDGDGGASDPTSRARALSEIGTTIFHRIALALFVSVGIVYAMNI